MIGSEPIGFSGSQFCFVVESLNNAAGELAFSPKPVQQQRSMPPQLLRHFLRWLNLRSHRPLTPSVQKLACPIRRSVRPEQLKLLFTQLTPDRLQIVAQKFCQLWLLLGRQILWSLEQQPARVGQYRFKAVPFQLLGLLGTNLVNCLAQVRHDVKPIQNMNRMTNLLSNHLQVRFPHVAANVAQPAASVLAQPAEELQQSLRLPVLASPQKPSAAGVNLVNQRQNLCPRCQTISSTSIASIADKSWWARPQATAISTELNTWSQVVRNVSATSFQLKRLAQPARNQA